MKLLKEGLHTQFAIPVIRETRASHLEGIANALADGGMKILEITLMSDNAFEVIKKLSQNKELTIAAGTVLTSDQAKKAIDAGAKFLVSPGLNLEAVQVAKQHSIPFIPGVITPTEVMLAQRSGCEMVKIFPVTQFGGVNYLRSLQAPFPTLAFMATGGITFSDITPYYRSGCTCIGLGNHLTPIELVNGQDWKAITHLAEQHLQAVKDSHH